MRQWRSSNPARLPLLNLCTGNPPGDHRAVADHGRTIRIPVHMTDRIRLMYRVANDLSKTWAPQPLESLL